MSKRLLAFILAAILLCLSLFGCANEEGTTDTTQQSTTGTESTEFIPPTPKDDILKSVVMTIGDFDITYETYRYLYMDCLNNYKNKGITKTADQIKSEVLEELFYQCAIGTLANQYDVNLTKTQKDEIDNAYNDLLAACTEYGTDLLGTLAKNYMTPKQYKNSYGFEAYLVNNVFEYCSNAENEAVDFSEEAISAKMGLYYRAQMIFVAINEDRNESNAMKKAEGIIEKLNNGEDFVEMVETYSDSESDSSAEVGFYFTETELDEAVWQAYIALADGEYTASAVQTKSGFYILKRVALDEKHFKEKLYPYYACNDLIKETKTSLSVTYTDFYNKMFNGIDLVHEVKESK